MHRSATTATLSRSCECRWSRGSRARRRLMQQRRKRSRNRIEILFRSGPVQRSLCMYDAIKHECIEAVYPCSIADVCRLRGVAMLRARDSDPRALRSAWGNERHDASPAAAAAAVAAAAAAPAPAPAPAPTPDTTPTPERHTHTPAAPTPSHPAAAPATTPTPPTPTPASRYWYSDYM